ncbi:MAG: helix-turn-helix transcriptional regulator [Clostridiales bacterium]|nr:helix-turn-helix transcriptional regulator [Clostridiales bacterium]
MKEYKVKEILIFKSAWELFSEKGFHDTKISEIAKKAGIGKGTVYEYFKSKEELVQKMIIFNLETAYEELIVEIEGVDSPEEKLRIIGRNDIKRGMDMLKIMKIIQMVDDFDKVSIKNNVFEILNKRFIIIENIIKEGMKKGIFNVDISINGAMLYIGTMNNAMMISNFVEKNIVDMDSVLEFVIDKLKK